MDIITSIITISQGWSLVVWPGSDCQFHHLITVQSGAWYFNLSGLQIPTCKMETTVPTKVLVRLNYVMCVKKLEWYLTHTKHAENIRQ